MISLAAHELCWIKGGSDDPEDQCAHGKVALEIDGVSLVRPEDGEWTVSAAALFLLRTLTADHTPERLLQRAVFSFPAVDSACGSAATATR
jgi:hypothetical protein